MHRRWTCFFQWLLACVIVMLLHWPVADYHWASYQFMPLMTNASGDPYHISGPSGDLTSSLSEYTRSVALGLPEAFFAALLGILIYCALGRWFGDHSTQTRCRHCTQVLCGLTKPECPHCGECI